jgi:hypothetical protein
MDRSNRENWSIVDWYELLFYDGLSLKNSWVCGFGYYGPRSLFTNPLDLAFPINKPMGREINLFPCPNNRIPVGFRVPIVISTPWVELTRQVLPWSAFATEFHYSRSMDHYHIQTQHHCYDLVDGRYDGLAYHCQFLDPAMIGRYITIGSRLDPTMIW